MTTNPPIPGDELLRLEERIARIISPETWRCLDAWEDSPPSVKEGCARTLVKAKEILKLVGPSAKPARTLSRIPAYVAGVLDTFPMSDGLRSTLLSWSDEAIATLNRAPSNEEDDG